MKPWMLAVVLRPFVMLFLGVFILYPIRKLVERLPRNKVTRLLLRRVGP